jgi:hypothetical protein
MKRSKGKSLGGTGKWAPKLTFEERCGFYYAFLLGIPREVIVRASGLNRGTVVRLTNRKYKAYGEVHLKFDELQSDAFRERYYTPEIVARLAAAQPPAPAPAAPGV